MRRKKIVLFLRSNVSPISTIKQDRESGVVSLCWTEIPNQNMIINLNRLAATVRSFKMLFDYTLDLTPIVERQNKNCHSDLKSSAWIEIWYCQ